VKIALLLITVGLAASGQDSSPTVKGHRVGESFNEYLSIAKGSPENAARTLTDCAALLNDRKLRKKRESEVDGCLKITKIADGQTALIQDGLNGFMFVSKKLVMVKLTIMEPFDKVKRDLVEKYGPPDKEEEVRYQNGFGAVFVHPRATWEKRPDVMVEVSEDAKPVVEGTPNFPTIYPITVNIMDQSWAKSLTEKEQKQPNSID
jgi:hypothetical protein